MNPDNFNMSEQELNAQRRRRAENFKLNIDESEYEDDNFVKSEDEPSNLNSYSGQDVKKQMARESKQVLKQKKKEEKIKELHSLGVTLTNISKKHLGYGTIKSLSEYVKNKLDKEK